LFPFLIFISGVYVESLTDYGWQKPEKRNKLKTGGKA
jgi:hypothetical protein